MLQILMLGLKFGRVERKAFCENKLTKCEKAALNAGVKIHFQD